MCIFNVYFWFHFVVCFLFFSVFLYLYVYQNKNMHAVVTHTVLLMAWWSINERFECVFSSCAAAAHRINRELSWIKYRIFSCIFNVCGRGCFHYICNNGTLLQVSCSTQKLLPLPQVSVQIKKKPKVVSFWFVF